MSLSAALEIGKAGLRIYQVATEVASENIANVNTPGYSRQRVVLATAPPTTHNGFPLGSGVQIQTVERYYDSLLQKQLVNAGTTSGYDEKKAEVLQQIEPIFNELAQDGLGASISDFFNSWQDLSLNPTGGAERQSVLSNAQIMTDQFHYIYRTLNDAAIAQNDAVEPMADDINNILSNIAQLNGQIEVTEMISGNANEMRDERDYLVRQLAENMAVSFTENADGTTDISYTDGTGTYSLVDGSAAATLSVINSGTLATDGTTPRKVVQVTPAGGGATTTIAPTTGTLGSVMVMRDTTIPGYLTQVNGIASSIVTEVNAIHSTGFTLVPSTGVNFFTNTGTTARTITVAISDTNLIAASQDATSPGDNSNALELAALLNEKTMSGGTSTYNNYYDGLVAQVGLDVQSAQKVVKQDEAFMKQLTTLRDSNSGVSLDEELTDLIKFQRSYQASAKLITTAGEMLDTLINMVQ